jgi:ABC-type antimicrobial peptide transport system permease subunit
MSAFAVFALFLSALGLFGILASSVANRTQEIGVRIILGAQRTDILKMILRRAFALTAAGILIGLAAGLPAVRYLQTLLFHVGPTDPATLGIVSAVIVLAGLIASYVPARRATGITPTEALRYE